MSLDGMKKQSAETETSSAVLRVIAAVANEKSTFEVPHHRQLSCVCYPASSDSETSLSV